LLKLLKRTAFVFTKTAQKFGNALEHNAFK